MVLCMRLETTSPTTILRRPAACGSSAECVLDSAILLFLRSARGGQFALASDGLHPRYVPAQAANLLQALGLSHVELELQLEKLVAELALLRNQFVGGQIPYFFRFHISSAFASKFLANRISSAPLRASQTRSATAACARPDAWLPWHPAA